MIEGSASPHLQFAILYKNLVKKHPTPVTLAGMPGRETGKWPHQDFYKT